MKLFLVFAFVCAMTGSVLSQDLTCQQLEEMGESGIRKMFVQENGATIPQNMADIDARCNDGKKLYKTMLEYKKCLKPFPQQIFQTTSQSVGKLLKKNCGDAAGKETALKLAKCATPEKVKEGQQCAVGSLDAIEKLSKSDEPKAVLIAKACCLAHVATDCARSKLSGIACPDSPVKPLDYFEEVLNLLSKDALELACQDYKDMAACQAKIPAAVTELQAMVNTQNNVLGNRSLFKPVLELAEKVAN